MKTHLRFKCAYIHCHGDATRDSSVCTTHRYLELAALVALCMVGTGFVMVLAAYSGSR